jgi:hypothetical protein
MSQDAEMFLKAPGAVSRITEAAIKLDLRQDAPSKNRDKKMTTTVRVRFM